MRRRRYGSDLCRGQQRHDRHHAYWTSALGTNGALNAFSVLAQDNIGALSVGAVTTQVNVIPSGPTYFHQFGPNELAAWVPAGPGAFATLDGSGLPEEVGINYATGSANDAALLRLTYQNVADFSAITTGITFGVQLGNDDRFRIRVLDAIGGQYLEEFTGLDTGSTVSVAVAKEDLDAQLDLPQITKVETWFYGAGTGVWQLGASANVPPEISVRGSDNSEIADGDVTPSIADGTDFGSVEENAGISSSSFTISNGGSVPLNLIGNPDKVLISGTHASDFTVIQQPSTPIAGGGDTTFTISFDPSGVGLREAMVSIANDDSEDPLSIFDT